MIDTEINEIITHFDYHGNIGSIEKIKTGHINQSYHLINKDLQEDDYLLQRINTSIFMDVDGLMNNIHLVTTHCNHQLEDSTLTVILTVDQSYYYEANNGSCWRLYKWMKDYRSYDIPDQLEQLYRGGKGFGRFLTQLSDITPSSIHSTLPNFHSLSHRVGELRRAQLNKALSPTVQLWIDEAMYLFQLLSPVQRAIDTESIPLRITHNDTKFNNIMLHNSLDKECIVDLETIMPGYVIYDYGDGIRTSSCPMPEDEQNLDAILIDEERIQAFHEGYLSMTSDLLTPEEKELLPLAGPLLSFLMGIRFLSDYIQGNVYYKIDYQEHNFNRAKAQLTLCRRLLKR